MTPDNYVELHAHSCYSLLDGAATPEALLDRAAELGMGSLALTEHDNLYGLLRFTLAARERGIHPVVGAEITLEDGRHLVLLVEKQAGYRNLCYLLSRAQLDHEKGAARLAWAHLPGHTRGLIALTGCRNGVLAAPLRAGDRAGARRRLDCLAALFGRDHLYVELQHHLHPDDDQRLEVLASLARETRLPVVATNNVHYTHPEGHRLQDVLVAIRHNAPLAACRNRLYPNAEYYLKAGRELPPLLAAYPDALANTAEIAARCRVRLNFRAWAVPPAQDGEGDGDARLEALCTSAVPRLYPGNAAAARAQLRHELAVIRKIQLAGYFLMVWDIVRVAREQGIQVRGRGSAAGSIVAYLLGITNVDPLAHNLLFERFLSAETRVMPDIDLDFCSRRREEMIQYVYARYGERHVGMVANHVTYRARSAVRDVGKALGLPADLLDRLAKSHGKWGARGSEYDPAEEAERYGVPPRLWTQFVELQAAIQGFPRHLGIHVGGMCITAAPLDEIVPLERATMPGRVVTQWDKDGIEDAGLIKLDLLSLRTLSAVDECLRLVRDVYGRTVDLDALPLNDPAVYDQLCRADTVGAFQVESRAQQQALVQMKPRVYNDIVVEVALIRPGPLQGNMVHPFFRRRQGLEPVVHLHPLLAPILQETLGIIVFQEQVMQVAMVMGGFSAGEADMLRRAMSRHRSAEQMAAFRQRFIDGAVRQGVDEAVADDVFTKLMGFASFGFCKSHAAAFAKTAYDTLWLRAHYPAAYYCALLNNQPMGFYHPRVLVSDARRHGVAVRPVHVNRSLAACALEENAIRLGFLYVEGMGEAGAGRVVEARPAEGYADLADLCWRTRLPRRLVERIILAGGLDAWDRDRRGLLWDLGRLRYQEEELPLPPAPDGVELAPMTHTEELVYEYQSTGISAQGHLMELFRERLERAGIGTSLELGKARQGERVRVAGLVAVRQAPPTAKGFAFFALEDEWGLMNVIVRPDIFQAQRETYVSAAVLMVEGQVQRAHGQTNLMAEQSWRLR